MRVLVTGSRDWQDYEAVSGAIVRAVQAWLEIYPQLQRTTVTQSVVPHGACPTGADALADQFCTHVTNWTVERHPADWAAYGRAAGFRRNAEMVELGADLCLAFIGFCTSVRCDLNSLHPSHGASHTADLAEQRGIPTVRYHSPGLAAHLIPGSSPSRSDVEQSASAIHTN